MKRSSGALDFVSHLIDVGIYADLIDAARAGETNSADDIVADLDGDDRDQGGLLPAYWLGFHTLDELWSYGETTGFRHHFRTHALDRAAHDRGAEIVSGERPAFGAPA